MLNRLPAILLLLLYSGSSVAAIPAKALVEQLAEVRGRVVTLESSLIDGLKGERQGKENVRKIQQLLALQKQERAIGQKRMEELERTVGELETRRETLRSRLKAQQYSLQKLLIALEGSIRPSGEPLRPADDPMERLEAPRRKVLANLVDRGIKEIEAYRIDLADAERLEERIQDEKQQLAYLFQDLREQESILELNRQLQLDLLKKKRNERLAQLENYRMLKKSEAQVSELIGEFNARIELERTNEAERQALKAMNQGVFAKLKGKLPLPADGKVVSSYGRAYDAKSRLFVFKKGVDISTGKKSPVKAISAGKVVYSGELPEYGRVTIIDHGDHFYSLCAHLGELSKKPGDPVIAGDPIGQTDESGTPLYFEIRARNIAVNPLQWVSN